MTGSDPGRRLGDAAYETESCFDCGGSGVDDRDLSDCETCNATGELFTEGAIALQLAVDEEWADADGKGPRP